MKKTLIIVMAAAVLCLMGACQKEGVYNPKKKIANIYAESTSTYAYYDGEQWQEESYNEPKALKERWTWDGNLLTKIETPYTSYIDEEEITEYETTNFIYDGKQLIEANNGEEKMTFTYDGKKIDKAQVFELDYSSTTPVEEVTFTYDGKKIVSLTLTELESDGKAKAKTSRIMQMFTRSIFPDVQSFEKIESAARQRASKSGSKGFSETITLTWDGNNVSKIEANGISIEYTYDNMNNPYNGFIFSLFGETAMGDDNFMTFGNENNCTKVVYKQGSYSQSMEYTYTYDGKWPVSCTSTNTYNEDEERSTYSRTTYLEYK